MRRRTWAVAGAFVLVGGTAIGGVIATSGGGHATKECTSSRRISAMPSLRSKPW